jgi:hypothetical protein
VNLLVVLASQVEVFMPDIDSLRNPNYYLDIPACNEPFFLKGSGALTGDAEPLVAVFRPTGRTVMLP